MGSFSELVMSFPLRADVGPDVLASFASLAKPHPDAPELPPPNPVDHGWDLDQEWCDMSDPWSKDWGEWLGASYTTAYIGSDQGASMLWRVNQWVVTCRATWKASPWDFVRNLAVLGSVIDDADSPGYDGETPDDVVTGFFVGYTRHEYEPRPTLLWASGGVLKGEDLNPPDLRY